MTTKHPESPQDLRRRAEELFRTSGDLVQGSSSPEEVIKLLHELQVHQIELEMQNEELRRVQEELDASHGPW